VRGFKLGFHFFCVKNYYVNGSFGVRLIVDKMRKWTEMVWTCVKKEETKAVRAVMKMNVEGKRGRRRRPKKRWLAMS